MLNSQDEAGRLIPMLSKGWAAYSRSRMPSGCSNLQKASCHQPMQLSSFSHACGMPQPTYPCTLCASLRALGTLTSCLRDVVHYIACLQDAHCTCMPSGCCLLFEHAYGMPSFSLKPEFCFSLDSHGRSVNCMLLKSPCNYDQIIHV